MSATARARGYLLQGDPALALGVCEAALADASGEDAVALRAMAAQAARSLADLPAERAHLEAAEAAARAAHLDTLAPLLLALGELHLRRADPALAAVTLEDALEHADEPTVRARVQAALEEARARETEEPDPEPEQAAPVAEEAPEGSVLDMLGRLLEEDSELPMEGVADLILRELLRAVHADRGFVLLQEPGEDLVVRAARDARGDPVPDPARQVSRRVAQRAASEARTLRAVRPDEDPRFGGSRSAKALDLRAVVAAPLRYRRQGLGCVVLDRRGRKGVAFSEADEALVGRFAKLASSVLVRARRRDLERVAQSNLRRVFATATEQVQTRFSADGFVGRSQSAYQLLRFMERVAPSHAQVLIRGESGTGKDLVARLLHTNSPRHDGPFLAINCAALPEDLLESELFGHVAGAFTGATDDRDGLFVQADGGTLFLDEVGDASPRLQAELLRVLQEGEVRKVGAADLQQVDVRVLAATHQDLEGMVAAGHFREDLLYRLNAVEVWVPPLRERLDDLPALVAHFTEEARAQHDAPETLSDVPPEDVAAWTRRRWPGNLRELRNAVLRKVTLGELRLPPLEPPTAPTHAALHPGRDAAPAPRTLAEAERCAILAALEHASGQKLEAAKILGISRRTLYNKLKAHNLS